MKYLTLVSRIEMFSVIQSFNYLPQFFTVMETITTLLCLKYSFAHEENVCLEGLTGLSIHYVRELE